MNKNYIEQLEAELEHCQKVRHLLAGDKIDLRSENAGLHGEVKRLKAALVAADELADVTGLTLSRKPSPVTGGRLILEADLKRLETSRAAYLKAKREMV